ncbi:ATP-binding protein [Lichenihabitans psoromatis]|uniref:ATP-binding protein n=1 Tax=Lichenihabitans psoromatis TaxID=2528642 RepID=UPI001FE10D64|nr:ATP-binding protein [Lichenihabitans psoromatis]
MSSAFWSFFILLISGITLSEINFHAAELDFDERLGVYLRALIGDVAAAGDEGHGAGQLGEPMFELPLSGWYWQITRLDQAKPDIRASKSLFAERLPQLADTGAPITAGGIRRGYAIGPDDRRLRIVERFIDAGDDGRYLVQVAASPEEMSADIDGFNLALGLTFGVLGLVLVGSTAVQLRYGLRPLRRIRDGVAAIRRGEAERIEGRFTPDLAPLAGELNLLISSNREIVERARTHVGNLAHALKTPLSVLVNEADAQTSGGSQDLSTQDLAAKVREQTGVMRDQVSYYLDRARAAARVSVIGTVTEVKPTVDALVRTFGKIYRDRDLAFEVTVSDSLRFRGEKQDFDDLIGNLIDNAGKWAKREVRVRGEAAQDDRDGITSDIVLMVDDDGPGLSADVRDLVTRRGRRLDETKPGSGLGLSIVTDLAAAYGGGLTLLDSPLGGLRAVLRLPGAG